MAASNAVMADYNRELATRELSARINRMREQGGCNTRS